LFDPFTLLCFKFSIKNVNITSHQANNFGLTWPAGQAKYYTAWSGQAKILKIQPGLVDGLLGSRPGRQL
jgi:hypothetical protein